MKVKLKDLRILVLDMDGTLYRHDGENGTVKNSSLIKAVIANSIQFVIDREGCSRETAAALVEEARSTDNIGISSFMAKRYGITRGEYFNETWNIDPGKIIDKSETPAKTIRKMAQRGKRLFLLTGAPRVWMENVLKYLVLEDVFERKYHGEMFARKTEIFESLARDFEPASILSAGDQFETDLKPAKDLGMDIFEVKNPKDLLKLL